MYILYMYIAIPEALLSHHANPLESTFGSIFYESMQLHLVVDKKTT